MGGSQQRKRGIYIVRDASSKSGERELHKRGDILESASPLKKGVLWGRFTGHQHAMGEGPNEEVGRKR